MPQQPDGVLWKLIDMETHNGHENKLRIEGHVCKVVRWLNTIRRYKMIKVEYSGKYPCLCMGRLKIYKGNKLIYDKEFCCTSSGNVWFDDDWNEHVESGILTWVDAKEYDQEIQDAVAEVLSGIDVCCGGCV